MNRVKIAIFFSLIVLIGLIVISIFLAKSGENNNKVQEVTKKPAIEETSSKINPSVLLSEAKNIPILKGEEADKNFELQEKMPYITKDFEMGYSDLTGKFYIYKKTSNTDEEINRFLENTGLNNYQSFFEFTVKSVNQTIQVENEKVIVQKEKSLVNFNIPLEDELQKSDDFELLKKAFTQIIGSIYEIENLVSSESANIIPSDESISPNLPPSTGSITLDSIFNEAGTKVGTPPKILRGVMTRECPPLINLSNEKIIEYSNPGNGIPVGHGCFRNSIGASGPMQFLPDVWTSYASSVNRFGGYTHTPYIANMRDSVYAAAWKLKRDSQTSDLNWSYEQVKRAVICYNAGCGRLDNPPSSTLRYLEAVWSIYKS